MSVFFSSWVWIDLRASYTGKSQKRFRWESLSKGANRGGVGAVENGEDATSEDAAKASG